MAEERRFEPDVVVDEELLDVTGAGNPRGQRLRQAAAAVLGQQQSEHDEVEGVVVVHWSWRRRRASAVCAQDVRDGGQPIDGSSGLVE